MRLPTNNVIGTLPTGQGPDNYSSLDGVLCLPNGTAVGKDAAGGLIVVENQVDEKNHVINADLAILIHIPRTDEELFVKQHIDEC